MSVYEYERAAFGLGTNGSDGIILGPGVSVPPPEGELLIFIDELKAQQGPFVYIDKETPQGKKFVKWMSEYEPSFFEWFSKLALVRGAAQVVGDAADWVAQLPGWVKSETIQVQKWLYDQYLASTTRVDHLLRQQGKVLSTTISQMDAENFIAWWKAHDLPGAAALVAMYSSGAEPPDKLPPMDLPKGLYDYWKTTGGTQPPPKKLVGLEPTWWDWTLNNWLWLAGGIALGVAGTRWYLKRRAAGAEERETVYGPPPEMEENPQTREGWGTDVNIKSGSYKLHPIIPETQYKRLRTMNMQLAKKFRVSCDGQSLGELHKSHGKRKWKALSYYGPSKYGNSRAALLTWLKEGAKEQAMEAVIEDLALPGPTVAPNLTRGVL